MKQKSQLRKQKRRPHDRTPFLLMKRKQQLLNQKRQPHDTIPFQQMKPKRQPNDTPLF
jgi:hypothetical protein